LAATYTGAAMPCSDSVALVANGAIQDYTFIEKILRNFEFVIAVDGGLQHCHKMKIMPDLILGDLDSIDQNLIKTYSQVPIKRFPTEKNETDLELAIQWAFEEGANEITLLAALGKRTDHSIYNLHLLRRYPGRVNIETESEYTFALVNNTHIPCKVGQTISFFPLGCVSGVSSKGLKWELDNVELNKDFMSISNICLANPVELTIKDGDLICCLHKSK